MLGWGDVLAGAATRARTKADARARARARAKEKARAKAKAKAHSKAKAAPETCVTTPAKKQHSASSKQQTAKQKAAAKKQAAAKRKAKGKTAAATKPTPSKAGTTSGRGKACTPPKTTTKKPTAKRPVVQPPSGAGFTPTPPAAPVLPAGAYTPAPAAAAGFAAGEAAVTPPTAPPAYPPASTPLPTPAGPTVPTAPVTPSTPTAPVAFGRAQAERLLWRAGFGPRPGDIDRLVAMGRAAAVRSLVYPAGQPTLTGPTPRIQDGSALSPADLWGHDHLWWMDRMVRSDQPLVERMTLIWHDWFATSNDAMPPGQLIAQNLTLRRGALGGFKELLTDVTRDPAMLVWLNGVSNNRFQPNENYGRELMELFTLGANRGAYTETDVREMARALTGWWGRWPAGGGWLEVAYADELHDPTDKTVFGKTGPFGESDAIRLAVEHPLHASFFVRKLWGSFIPTPPDAETQARLEKLYVDTGHQIAPVVEQILLHPDLYGGQVMIKPPVVFATGLLRALGRGIDTDVWVWACRDAGQLLFSPPNVAGWDDTRWLDTATWRGRWQIALWALQPTQPDAWSTTAPYSSTEDAATAVAKALASLGDPSITPELGFALQGFSASALPADTPAWGLGPYRAMRYSALRLLLASSPDLQTS